MDSAENMITVAAKHAEIDVQHARMHIAWPQSAASESEQLGPGDSGGTSGQILW